MRSVARGQDCDGDAAPSCSAALGVGALPHGSVLQARGASEGIADREAESLVEGDVGRIRCLQVARETCLVGALTGRSEYSCPTRSDGDRRSAPASPSDPASSHTSQSSTLPTLACAQFVNEGRLPGAISSRPSSVSFWKYR